MTKCKNDSLKTEEFTCFQCVGKGRWEDGTMCDVCDGTGSYLDACCEEHALEYEEEQHSAYLSTCSVCGNKYSGNGYNETKLPCPACLKKQRAASISKSAWYLVRKDREMKPWAFYVYGYSFKTATQADVYAEMYGLHGYHPTHGYAIIQHQEDEAAGLAQIIYMNIANAIILPRKHGKSQHYNAIGVTVHGAKAKKDK